MQLQHNQKFQSFFVQMKELINDSEKDLEFFKRDRDTLSEDEGHNRILQIITRVVSSAFKCLKS